MRLLSYYNLKRHIISLLILLTGSCVIGQSSTSPKISPKKALFLSATIPGLGQFYNKKYWKIPVVYATMGSCLYLYTHQNKKYHQYGTAYNAKNDNNESTVDLFPQYSNSNLITLQDYHRNNRDLFGLLFILSYILNILDANIDAHMFNYNVNDILTINIRPELNDFNYETINLSLNLKF